MKPTQPAYTKAPPADFVLPFDLPALHLRGRFVRLDDVSTRAMAAHPLPEAATRALGEMLALNALLGSALKLEGRVSIQTQSNGPLNLIASDFFAGGGLRGYARIDVRNPPDADAEFAALAGAGSFAITIEPTPGATPYQGIVSLKPEGLAASAEGYFAQSEQLPTLLKLAAGPVYRSGKHGWCAGGMMVQAVPKSATPGLAASDDWRRIQLFLGSLEAYELLDPSIAAEDVLWRLFHEDEVRVHPAQRLHFQCGCDRARLERVLRSYPRSELESLPDADGIIRTRCEFCGTTYEFPFAEFS